MCRDDNIKKVHSANKRPSVQLAHQLIALFKHNSNKHMTFFYNYTVNLLYGMSYVVKHKSFCD